MHSLNRCWDKIRSRELLNTRAEVSFYYRSKQLTEADPLSELSKADKTEQLQGLPIDTFKQETYLNQPLFYINYTHNNKVITLNVYGYKPDNYKFIDKLGNLYIASNKPFYLIGCEPFKPEEFYKLMYIIYYDENDEQTQTEY